MIDGPACETDPEWTFRVHPGDDADREYGYRLVALGLAVRCIECEAADRFGQCLYFHNAPGVTYEEWVTERADPRCEEYGL